MGRKSLTLSLLLHKWWRYKLLLTFFLCFWWHQISRHTLYCRCRTASYTSMISLFLLFICVVLFPRARAPWLQITSQIMTIKTTLGKFALACCWLLTWLSCHPLRPLTLSFIHKYLWHLETGPPLCPLSTNATPPPLTLRVWVCPSVWLWSCHDQTPGCTGEPQSTSGFSHRSGSYCFLCWFFL